MTTPEQSIKGIRPFNRESAHLTRTNREKSTDYLANVLWNSGLLVRITRPTVRQLKKDGIGFFGSVEVEGVEVRIPVVVKGSTEAAKRYRDANQRSIRRKGIMVVVARDNKDPKVLQNQFRRSLANHLKIRLSKHAGVAELVNAPV